MGVAIGYFVRQGFTVCIPLTDSQDFDLVIDEGGGLKKVQVKTCRHKNRTGSWMVELRTKGGNRTGTGKVKNLNREGLDSLFVVVDDGSAYRIPASECPATTITLGSGKWAQYKVM